MLTYDLEQRGALARYDYLYRCIKADILSGKIAAGEKMPSKRTLAGHLETAVVTVENAYAQLVAEGYLRAEEKRGYFVNPVEAKADSRHEPAYRPDAEPKITWQLDMKRGGSETEGFPFSVWARLMRRVITDQGTELLRAIPHNGVFELRSAIAHHLYQFRGISASPDQIIVGAGTEYLYNLLVQMFGRDCVYGAEDPGYSKAVQVYGLNGANCVPLQMDPFGVQVKDLEANGVQILHISPNHQFPTGIIMPITRRQELLRWADEKEDRYIIEDDYDSEFRFTGRPIPAFQSVDRQGKVIYINTFSRSLAPSLRISYMVIPRRLLGRYRERLGFYSCTVPAMEQYTLARFLEDGHFESHVNRMRIFYRGQRDQVIAAIQNSALSKRCRVIGQDAGLHFLIKLETEIEDAELAKKAAGHKIRLAFLTDYQREMRAAQNHTLVINYPGVDLARLSQSLETIAGLLENKNGGRPH